MLVSRSIYVVASIATLWLAACGQANRTISRPSITPDSDWQLVEQSPYVYGGVAKGDHLIGHGLKIKIEALNASGIPQLVIRMEFFVIDENPIKFTPSSTTVELSSGQNVQVIGQECRAALLQNPGYRRSVTPIREIVFSQKYNCIDLYFEVVPPSVEDVFNANCRRIGAGKTHQISRNNFSRGNR